MYYLFVSYNNNTYHIIHKVTYVHSISSVCVIQYRVWLYYTIKKVKIHKEFIVALSWDKHQGIRCKKVVDFFSHIYELACTTLVWTWTFTLSVNQLLV